MTMIQALFKVGYDLDYLQREYGATREAVIGLLNPYMKSCSDCGDSFPATYDNFGTSAKSDDGMGDICSLCSKGEPKIECMNDGRVVLAVIEAIGFAMKGLQITDPNWIRELGELYEAGLIDYTPNGWILTKKGKMFYGNINI